MSPKLPSLPKSLDPVSQADSKTSEFLIIDTKSTYFMCAKSEILFFIRTGKEKDMTGNEMPTLMFKGGHSYTFDDLENREEVNEVVRQVAAQWKG